MKPSGPFRAVFGAGETMLDRILCVAGAVTFSQGPEFMQQYLQRLGGHLEEARRQLGQFRDAATQSGQTLDQLIASSRASADAAIARLGGVIEASGTRVADLAAAEEALRTATPWTRPWQFSWHLDTGIARDTWAVFQPAVPTTIEGALYASAGLLTFLLVYHGLIKVPLAAAWRRLRGRPPGPATTIQSPAPPAPPAPQDPWSSGPGRS